MMGSYYIVGDIIFYNLEDGGLDHSIFWEKIVFYLFNKLSFENKVELIECPYGTDRGRVTENYFLGTPRSILFIKELKNIFKTNFSLTTKDSHYKIQKHDQLALKNCLSLENLDLKFKVIEYKSNYGFLLIKNTLNVVYVDGETHEGYN